MLYAGLKNVAWVAKVMPNPAFHMRNVRFRALGSIVKAELSRESCCVSVVEMQKGRGPDRAEQVCSS